MKTLAPLKIAVVGVPGSGKASLVQAMVAQWGRDPLTVTELSGAHAVFGRMTVPGGSDREVHLHTFYGDPDFSGLQTLILQGCQGVVFVADAQAERIPLAPVALQGFLRDAERAGVDFSQTPTAMQYHRAELFPGFQAEDMDRFLKISTQYAPRFTTSSESVENALVAIQWVIRAAMEKEEPVLVRAAS